MKLRRLIVALFVIVAFSAIMAFSATAAYQQPFDEACLEEAFVNAYLETEDASLEQAAKITAARAVVARAAFEAIAPTMLQEYIHGNEWLMEAVTYAYLDVEMAPPGLRQQILQARHLIIHSQSWFVGDSLYEYVRLHCSDTWELIERFRIYNFSYLFPGWDGVYNLEIKYGLYTPTVAVPSWYGVYDLEEFTPAPLFGWVYDLEVKCELYTPAVASAPTSNCVDLDNGQLDEVSQSLQAPEKVSSLSVRSGVLEHRGTHYVTFPPSGSNTNAFHWFFHRGGGIGASASAAPFTRVNFGLTAPNGNSIIYIRDVPVGPTITFPPQAQGTVGVRASVHTGTPGRASLSVFVS